MLCFNRLRHSIIKAALSVKQMQNQTGKTEFQASTNKLMIYIYIYIYIYILYIIYYIYTHINYIY